MQENIADILGTDPVTPASITDDTVTDSDTVASTSETEQKLANEIGELWAIHTDAQSVVKKTQQELKSIRERLGENLFQMKILLARPGRSGRWQSYLAQVGISRTTADRLCAAHAKKLNFDGKGTTGAVPQLSDDEIASLAKATWKKLEKKLGTKSSVYRFLAQLVAESGLTSFKFTRNDQRGLAVVDPDAVSTPQTVATAPEASASVPTSAAQP